MKNEFRKRRQTPYSFAGDAERRALLQDSAVNADAHHDGISGVEDKLRENSQLHGKHGHMPDDTGSDSDGQSEGLRITFQSCFSFVFLLLELFLFGLLVVLPVLGEGIKQVVDDLS